MMMGNDTESLAILLHRNKVTQSLAVVSHPVLKTKGGMTLGVGKLFSDSDKARVISILTDEQKSGGWIQDNLLYQDETTIVWYKQPGIYPINFKGVSLEAPYPGHVFMFNGSFYAFSYKGKGRPSLDADLYYSPTMNVYNDGHVCSGNISYPKRADTKNIPAWEDFFFLGTNTHFSCKYVIKNKSVMESDASFIDFWKELSSSGAKTFPSRYLSKMDMTLGEIVSC